MRFLALTLILCTLSLPTLAADEHKKKLEPADTKSLHDALGGSAATSGPVFTVTVPRSDLDLRNLQFGEIPVEAGIASTFRVFRCACGKYYLLGEFVLADYESNDVIDSLRQGHFKIASVGNMLLEEKPRLVSVRFQAEGNMPDLIKVLKDAYRWIGENRTKPSPIEN